MGDGKLAKKADAQKVEEKQVEEDHNFNRKIALNETWKAWGKILEHNMNGIGGYNKYS